MAEQDTPSDDQEDAPELSPKRGWLVWILVGAIAGGGGTATALFLAPQTVSTPDDVRPADLSGELPDHTQAAYVPFGEVIVNLDEGRLNRYLRLSITLQIDESQKVVVEELIEAKRLVLRNWLLSHISDKDLNEIRGAAGQNMLRREIRDEFNIVLFSDGYERVYDVLFEEFNVQ